MGTKTCLVQQPHHEKVIIMHVLNKEAKKSHGLNGRKEKVEPVLARKTKREKKNQAIEGDNSRS